jgi:hypothetical protein
MNEYRFSSVCRYIITKTQIKAIKDAGDILSAMIGVGTEFDPEAKRIVKNIDKFLKANGQKRNFL